MARKGLEFSEYRRKRENKTDYSSRLKYLKSGTERVVIRKTNARIFVQLIAFNPRGDKVIVSADSTFLKKYGWGLSGNSLPAAYLTGYLFSKIAASKKVDLNKDYIVDFGTNIIIKGNKLFAALKGVVDGGLKVKVGSDEVFPSEDRLKGKHISEHFKLVKEGTQYSKIKENKDLSDVPTLLDKVVKAINSGVKA